MSDNQTSVESSFAHVSNNTLLHSVRKVDTAHARIKKHALNQALYTSYQKIVFDTRVRK